MKCIFFTMFCPCPAEVVDVLSTAAHWQSPEGAFAQVRCEAQLFSYMLVAKQSVWTRGCLAERQCVLQLIWSELRGLVGFIHTPACLHTHTSRLTHCAFKLMWSNELLCWKSCTLLLNDPSITSHYRRGWKRDSVKKKFKSSFTQRSIVVAKTHFWIKTHLKKGTREYLVCIKTKKNNPPTHEGYMLRLPNVGHHIPSALWEISHTQQRIQPVIHPCSFKRSSSVLTLSITFKSQK